MSPQAALDWIISDDTGTSSITIWAVMMGARFEKPYRADVPCDWFDFGRCYRLLHLLPEWRLRLAEVAAQYPAWAGMVAEWDDLSALYERELPSGRCPRLYARMRQLRGLSE